MSICILGNSHVRTLERFVSVQRKIRFLSAPGESISHLKLEGGKLFARDEELAAYLGVEAGEEIDIAAYSAVVVYGCQLVSAGKGNSWIRFCKSSHLYSVACLERAFEDRIKSTFGYDLVRGICAFHPNVWVVPSPFPNCAHHLVDEQLELAPLVARLKKRFLQTFAKLGAKATWVPDELTDDNGYTVRRQFQLNREGDFSHLNRQGVELTMNFICQQVGTAWG